MNSLISILTDFDEIPPKAILGVIALIFWGISSLSKLGKKTTPPIKRVSTAPTPSPRPVQPPQRSTPGTKAMADALRAQVRQQQAVSKGSGRPPALPPSAAARPARIDPRRISAVAPEMTTIRPPSPAAELRKVLQAQNLRQQWLLTEILGKPLAFRDDRSE